MNCEPLVPSGQPTVLHEPPRQALGHGWQGILMSQILVWPGDEGCGSGVAPFPWPSTPSTLRGGDPVDKAERWVSKAWALDRRSPPRVSG